jgi:hypothetical protein
MLFKIGCKAQSSTMAVVMIILVVVVSSVWLYYWVSTSRTPMLREKDLQIMAHSLNSTTMRVTNKGNENSTQLNYMSTSHGPCNFPGAPVVLEPGVPLTCSFDSSVSGTVTVYAPGISPYSTDF